MPQCQAQVLNLLHSTLGVDRKPRDAEGLPTLSWSGPDRDWLSGLSLQGPGAVQGGVLRRVVQHRRVSAASFLKPGVTRPALPRETAKLAPALPSQACKNIPQPCLFARALLTPALLATLGCLLIYLSLPLELNPSSIRSVGNVPSVPFPSGSQFCP